MMYRDETETLREELRQTSAELARVSAELAKRDAKPRTEIQYRDRGGARVLEWVVVAVVLLGIVAISTFVAALALSSERGVTAAWIVCALSTAVMLRIWWRALPRVEVKR